MCWSSGWKRSSETGRHSCSDCSPNIFQSSSDCSPPLPYSSVEWSWLPLLCRLLQSTWSTCQLVLLKDLGNAWLIDMKTHINHVNLDLSKLIERRLTYCQECFLQVTIHLFINWFSDIHFSQLKNIINNLKWINKINIAFNIQLKRSYSRMTIYLLVLFVHSCKLGKASLGKNANKLPFVCPPVAYTSLWL